MSALSSFVAKVTLTTKGVKTRHGVHTDSSYTNVDNTQASAPYGMFPTQPSLVDSQNTFPNSEGAAGHVLIHEFFAEFEAYRGYAEIHLVVSDLVTNSGGWDFLVADSTNFRLYRRDAVFSQKVSDNETKWVWEVTNNRAQDFFKDGADFVQGATIDCFFFKSVAITNVNPRVKTLEISDPYAWRNGGFGRNYFSDNLHWNDETTQVFLKANLPREDYRSVVANGTLTVTTNGCTVTPDPSSNDLLNGGAYTITPEPLWPNPKHSVDWYYRYDIPDGFWQKTGDVNLKYIANAILAVAVRIINADSHPNIYGLLHEVNPDTGRIYGNIQGSADGVVRSSDATALLNWEEENYFNGPLGDDGLNFERAKQLFDKFTEEIDNLETVPEFLDGEQDKLIGQKLLRFRYEGTALQPNIGARSVAGHFSFIRGTKKNDGNSRERYGIVNTAINDDQGSDEYAPVAGKPAGEITRDLTLLEQREMRGAGQFPNATGGVIEFYVEYYNYQLPSNAFDDYNTAVRRNCHVVLRMGGQAPNTGWESIYSSNGYFALHREDALYKYDSATSSTYWRWGSEMSINDILPFFSSVPEPNIFNFEDDQEGSVETVYFSTKKLKQNHTHILTKDIKVLNDSNGPKNLETIEYFRAPELMDPFEPLPIGFNITNTGIDNPEFFGGIQFNETAQTEAFMNPSFPNISPVVNNSTNCKVHFSIGRVQEIEVPGSGFPYIKVLEHIINETPPSSEDEVASWRAGLIGRKLISRDGTFSATIQDAFYSSGEREGIIGDIDLHGEVDALTDALMVLRYLFALRGDALIQGAIATEGIRDTADEIEAYLADPLVREFLDVDGSGTVDALTDGLAILRYGFALRDEALWQGAVADVSDRSLDELNAAIEAVYYQTIRLNPSNLTPVDSEFTFSNASPSGSPNYEIVMDQTIDFPSPTRVTYKNVTGRGVELENGSYLANGEYFAKNGPTSNSIILYNSASDAASGISKIRVVGSPVTEGKQPGELHRITKASASSPGSTTTGTTLTYSVDVGSLRDVPARSDDLYIEVFNGEKLNNIRNSGPENEGGSSTFMVTDKFDGYIKAISTQNPVRGQTTVQHNRFGVPMMLITAVDPGAYEAFISIKTYNNDVNPNVADDSNEQFSKFQVQGFAGPTKTVSVAMPTEEKLRKDETVRIEQDLVSQGELVKLRFADYSRFHQGVNTYAPSDWATVTANPVIITENCDVHRAEGLQAMNNSESFSELLVVPRNASERYKVEIKQEMRGTYFTDLTTRKWIMEGNVYGPDVSKTILYSNPSNSLSHDLVYGGPIPLEGREGLRLVFELNTGYDATDSDEAVIIDTLRGRAANLEVITEDSYGGTLENGAGPLKLSTANPTNIIFDSGIFIPDGSLNWLIAVRLVIDFPDQGGETREYIGRWAGSYEKGYGLECINSRGGTRLNEKSLPLRFVSSASGDLTDLSTKTELTLDRHDGFHESGYGISPVIMLSDNYNSTDYENDPPLYALKHSFPARETHVASTQEVWYQGRLVATGSLPKTFQYEIGRVTFNGDVGQTSLPKTYTLRDHTTGAFYNVFDNSFFNRDFTAYEQDEFNDYFAYEREHDVSVFSVSFDSLNLSIPLNTTVTSENEEEYAIINNISESMVGAVFSASDNAFNIVATDWSGDNAKTNFGDQTLYTNQKYAMMVFKIQ